MNRKYYEVLPRIFLGDEDALLLSLRTGNKVTLDNYIFPCFYGHMGADVVINPVASSQIVEVAVISHADSACPKAATFSESKRFIDIGKTASGLAHGVRNPLNAIKGAVVYLREKYSQEPTLIEFTRIMEEEICRLDNFISKFLSCSLENTETATVNVNALLKKINALTALQAHTSNIRVSYEYGDVPEVNASFFHLEQAVLNVINNSIEAMHKGGTLAVKTFLERDGGSDYIVIRVSDTGGGMPVNQKSSTEAGKPGRGFGLFIAREMLQYYGGHLEIQSEKDKGTTVRLCLPVEADRKK
jgi:two-component system nitrogen regulation sensor histidine kinase GlnL